MSFVETLGNSTNILCKLDNSEVEFNISIQERSELTSGNQIHISFEAKNIHLFDKETGETIYEFNKEAKFFPNCCP